jgi:hypothetical protein
MRLGADLGSLWFLPSHRPFGARTYLFNLVRSNDLTVMTAIDGLKCLEVAEAHDRALARLAHPPPTVVRAVLRYLSQLFRDEALPILLEELRDERTIVRERAVDELDELDPPAFEAEVASHIRPLLDDPHLDVRSAARWRFAHLAGQLEPDQEAKRAKATGVDCSARLYRCITGVSYALNEECEVL